MSFFLLINEITDSSIKSIFTEVKNIVYVHVQIPAFVQYISEVVRTKKSVKTNNLIIIAFCLFCFR